MGGKMMMTEQFKHRLLTSCVAILTLVISVYYSFTPLFQPLFVLLNISVIGMALTEFYDLAKRKGFSPFVKVGIAASAAYLIALSFGLYTNTPPAASIMTLLFSLVFLFIVAFCYPTAALCNISITLFGVIYLMLPLSCILLINAFFLPDGHQDGRLWLAYVLLVSKITDIGAYFCGKGVGGTKLCPSISPKKTIAGSIGGVAFALIFSLLFTLFFAGREFQMTFAMSLWVGLIISLLAQLGDLSESLLKRDAGVQDSSTLPGLGGMLDMVDSLVFTLPFMYLLLKILAKDQIHL